MQKTRLLGIAAMTFVLSASFVPSPDVDAHGGDSFTKTDVLRFDNDEAVGGATLARTRIKVSLLLGTTELDPGAVYTVWWIYFTYPRHCTGGDGTAACGFSDLENAPVKPQVRYATGGIAGAGGIANFHASWRRGRPPEGMDVLVGDGHLRNTGGAEVHIIVRGHSEPEPGVIGEQIGSFGGNCTDDVDPNNPCGDQQFAVFLP